MYVVTFYSFKGGTGRTMAMVNVGVELAREGNSVLLVDFDLEAPGLDTFKLSNEAVKRRGMVDFVHDYLRTGAVPDVREYTYNSSLGSDFKSLMIMPAGVQNREYDSRFKDIDWKFLYDHQDGFLLFEDLKEQWRTALKPDYVLIDSRTGHTDTGGICTRQLPDAVVIMLFPNEQNRRGLQQIVEDIREERQQTSEKPIALHFVMSNVPDLDDEEHILAHNVEKLKETLRIDQFSAIVHHYSSLLLLDQAIFALERPNSRLTQEYRTLVRAIRKFNFEDRAGAIEFLEEVGQRLRTRRPPEPTSLELRLKEITSKHPSDSEILRRLARIRQRQRKSVEALALIDQAIAAGTVDSDLLLARADLKAKLGTAESAIPDLLRILGMSEVSPFDLIVAFRLLLQIDRSTAPQILLSPALERLDASEFVGLARELESFVETLDVGEDLIRSAMRRCELAQGITTLRSELILILIARGKFSDAIHEVTRQGTVGMDTLDVYDTFNYAMAKWALEQELSQGAFERVLQLHNQLELSGVPNYYQCISIAYWATGDKLRASDFVERSREAMTKSPDTVFSGWSYLNVKPSKFLADLEQLERMIAGEHLLPEFMLRAGLQLTLKM